MKDLLKSYVDYNIWANKKLFDVINKLPESKQMQTVNSSFENLFETVRHIWLAEEAWWKRHKLLENFSLDSENFEGTFSEMYKLYFKQANLWKDWLNTCTDKQLQHALKYVRKKKVNKLLTYQMIQHICNHGSYHRGQLVTMLHQIGVTKIPGTDFNEFSEKN